jgi:uncharacterized protein with von Willebrand factor type A (vWA) domain
MIAYPFFELFEQCQQENSLSIDDYMDFLHLLQTDRVSYVEEKNLRELCKLLWVKHPKRNEAFDRAFEQAWKEQEKELQASLASLPTQREQPDEIKPIPNKIAENEPKDAKDKPKNEPAKDEKEPEPTPQEKPAPQTETLYLSLGEEEGEVQDAEMQREEMLESHNFLFAKYHLTPLQDRDIQIQWRNFRKIKYIADDQEIDMDGCIEEVSKIGLLTRLHYQKKAVNEAKLVTIIDNSASMRAFKILAQQIAENISMVVQNEVYYCDNLLSQDFYTDYAERGEPIEQHEFYTQILPKKAVLLISDLGAVKGQYNSHYIEKMKQRVAEMSAIVPQIVCLNPMPKARWTNTSAYYMPFLHTWEASHEGLKSIVRFLK